jgi:hypothetical protein
VLVAWPQTFALPPPPHVFGEVQLPQELTVRVFPQLSVPVTLPQFLPSLEQNAAFDSAVHPHTLAVPPPPHVLGRAQVPHGLTVRGVPQLSVPVTSPQFFPSLEQNEVLDSAVQPQTLVVPPPPQVLGRVQVPQSRIAPHPSLTLPQFLPCSAHVLGSQPQIPPRQAPLWQSDAWPQVLPFAQRAPQLPPQSTSLSVPFFTPSVQLGTATHTPVGEQIPLVQSPGTPHALPSPQRGHEPPQSTSLSSPFLVPSSQADWGASWSIERLTSSSSAPSDEAPSMKAPAGRTPPA